MNFKNNPVMLAGRQFVYERFSRAWKAERTMNRKHLLFIEFNKHALYLYRLKGIFTVIVSDYPCISPGIIMEHPFLRIWKTGAQRN